MTRRTFLLHVLMSDDTDKLEREKIYKDLGSAMRLVGLNHPKFGSVQMRKCKVFQVGSEFVYHEED